MINFGDFIPFLKPAADVVNAVVSWRNTSVQARTQIQIAEKHQETELISAKLQYLRDRQLHDLDIAKRELDGQQTQQLVEYVQTAETMRHDRALEFERWRFEQQKALQREFEAKRASAKLESANIYRQAALDAAEHTKFLDHFPIQITPSTLLNEYALAEETSGRLPLLLILSPPEIEADPSRTTSLFPHSDAQIDAIVRELVNSYSGAEERIRFLGGAWTSKSRHGEVAIRTLHSALSKIPTLVVESQILGDIIEIRCGAWLEGKRAEYKPIAKIPYRKMLLQPQLPAQGVTTAGSGDANANVREFVKALAEHHGVIAAWFADAYYLTTYQAPPRLPHILGRLAPHLDPDLTKLIIQSYSQMFGSSGEITDLFAPAMSLSLAHSLTFLPDGRTLARDQLMDSLKRWLIVHGSGSSDTTSFEAAVRYVATMGDLEFLLGVQEVCCFLDEPGLQNSVDRAIESVPKMELPAKDEEGDTLHDAW